MGGRSWRGSEYPPVAIPGRASDNQANRPFFTRSLSKGCATKKTPFDRLRVKKRGPERGAEKREFGNRLPPFRKEPSQQFGSLHLIDAADHLRPVVASLAREYHCAVFDAAALWVIGTEIEPPETR